MNYTLLIYESAADLAVRSDPDPAKRAAYSAIWPPYTKALKDAGVFVEGAGLETPQTATVIAFRDGRRQVQDGPYADTKEQLGGFYIIDVPDLDSALDWAARFTHDSSRVIEVRPNLRPPG